MTTPSLMHLMLDLGIALHASFNHQPATEESIGVFTINGDVIDKIVCDHIGVGMSSERHLEYMSYVFDMASEIGGPPSPFMLADYFLSRYDALVAGKDGMADTNLVKAIPD